MENQLGNSEKRDLPRKEQQMALDVPHLGDSIEKAPRGRSGAHLGRDEKPFLKKQSLRRKKADAGISFDPFFVAPESNPFEGCEFIQATSKISDAEGQTFFEMKNVEVPKFWSQIAVDILVSKYFRKAGVPVTGHEISVKQVIHRISHTIRVEGERMGYFDAASAEVFEKELSYLLIHQMGAFNSPVWFNLGLYHEYAIEGSGGSFAWDLVAQQVAETQNAYARPQCSACFIQSVDDDLMSLFQLVKNEARLFKYGSGTGTNFSKIRGRQEKLSGGGYSSGLMSFLEVFDKGAGATKSGGTTRRAAKMVCLEMDHPEIVDFITWKSREEKKVAALIAAGYSSDFNGEAYKTVAGQNSNNSVRVSDTFMQAVVQGEKWNTRARTDGQIVETFEARSLWRMIAESAWSCADPGIQYDTTINDWHTCLQTDRIRASNPCSEFMFLDDTACNLASLNLVKFLKEDGSFDVEAYRRACRVFIVAQEILVDLSSYPTETIAKNSHDYRPLGLGYANLGTLLMLQGIPYDSDQARAWAGALTAIMCGHAYAVSAEEAAVLGPFAGFEANKESMLKVIGQHKDAAYRIDTSLVPFELAQAAKEDWEIAFTLGQKTGYRNSQVTVLAPTGTIGLLMDCDTTGVEPDFALVKFKKLAGGGYFKIVNQSVPLALRNLGYTSTEVADISRYLLGSMSFLDAPYLSREFLLKTGLTDQEVDKIEKILPGTFHIASAFTRFSLGEPLLDRLGIAKEEYLQSTFDFLSWAGLTSEQIAEANESICGTMTIEGAPHLKNEHLPVFDCANRCGTTGKRFIAPMGHVRMMAATQPFLSGAISKTVNLPHETTVEEIEEIYLQGWKLGLKAIALYRDGCKLSQPLSSQAKKSDKKSDTPESVKSAPVQPNLAQNGATITNASEQVSLMALPGELSQLPRRKLPAKRRGFTQEASVGGHKVYLRTGEYEDGTLGELFIDMHKEGAAYRSMMNCFAISVSLGLQYGVPLEEFVDKFTFTRFEPAGMVSGHPNVKLATSIVDYIFRVLGMEYLGRTDFVQVKPAMGIASEKLELKLATPEQAGTRSSEGQVLLSHSYSKDTQTNSQPNGKVPHSAKGARQQGGESPSASSDLATPSTSHWGASSFGQNPVGAYLAEMMGDAPPCDSCGHTTVRNGACYKCLNCGNSMGCS